MLNLSFALIFKYPDVLYTGNGAHLRNSEVVL
jgi:hypothetical protein